uniref:Uncharacterized protein n=2 Tax=Panagrolaimus sp. PS1159 TaxID=55785 RepID=A0AC35F8A2_9BILA
MDEYNYINPLANKKDESYFALISTELDNLLIRVVGTKTEEFIPNLSFKTSNEQKFVSDIPILFKENFKAVIIDIFPYQTKDYGNNIVFCMILRGAFEILNIPYYFVSGPIKNFTSLLIATNVNPKLNEIYLLILIDNNNKLAAVELKYTENGYIESSHRLLTIDIKESAEEIRSKIVKDCNPKKIIISALPGNTILKHLRTNVLKSKKLIVLEALFTHYIDKFLVEIGRWLLDKSYVKFFIQPHCARRIIIFAMSGAKNRIILSAEIKDPLPLKKTITVPKSHLDYFMIFVEDKTGESKLLYELEMKKTCHRHEITLTVDEDNFPDKQVKEIILDEIKNLPENLDKHFASKFPVIGIFDESAVICINKNGKYEFLESWNGVYGTPLIINFSSEKHTIGDKAIQQLEDPEYIVYDLIKIMSMEPDKIKIDESWTFTITEDSENPVLLEFDSFDGTKKAASPSFLMALILKEIRKLIKVEIGKKPKKLGFWIFEDSKYTKEELKRIQMQITESCQALKIECEFIKF